MRGRKGAKARRKHRLGLARTPADKPDHTTPPPRQHLDSFQNARLPKTHNYPAPGFRRILPFAGFQVTAYSTIGADQIPTSPKIARSSAPMIDFSSIDSDSLFGKALRLPLRLIPDHAVMRILQGPLKGKKWIAGSANHGCWLGSFEATKQRTFYNSIERGSTVYDVGANVGFYSLLSSEGVGPNGQVVSFEPLPRNLMFLRNHIQINDINNVLTLPLALSELKDWLPFDDSARHTQAKIVDEGNFLVHAISLDELVEQIKLPDPDLMKIDIEGSEVQMLRGGRQTIERAEPLIYLATHGETIREECKDLLNSIDYNLQPIDEDKNIKCSNEFFCHR